MRIDGFEQPMGKFRKLGVEFHLHTRGQERKPFEQPLNKRIWADFFCLPIKGEATGDLGEFASKLRRGFAQMR